LPVPLNRGIPVPKRACNHLESLARLVLVAWRSLHQIRTRLDPQVDDNL
jgi:hypothetical protein